MPTSSFNKEFIIKNPETLIRAIEKSMAYPCTGCTERWHAESHCNCYEFCDKYRAWKEVNKDENSD